MTQATAKARTKREQTTRNSKKRKSDGYKPPSLLPVPEPTDQYVFRWIRVSLLGKPDNKNVSAKFRDGWSPATKEDIPNSDWIVSDRDSEFGEENIEIGGLLLCKNSIENVEARREYIADLTQKQMDSVERNYLRENNPKMPVFSERSSRTTFGTGN